MIVFRTVRIPPRNRTSATTHWRVAFPAPAMFGELQDQVLREAVRSRHGVPLVARGQSTTSVRMAKKIAGWDDG